MKVRKIVYLIHSMLYSDLAATDPKTLRNTNAGIYLERELLWRTTLARGDPSTGAGCDLRSARRGAENPRLR